MAVVAADTVIVLASEDDDASMPWWDEEVTVSRRVVRTAEAVLEAATDGDSDSDSDIGGRRNRAVVLIQGSARTGLALEKLRHADIRVLVCDPGMHCLDVVGGLVRDVLVQESSVFKDRRLLAAGWLPCPTDRVGMVRWVLGDA